MIIRTSTDNMVSAVTVVDYTIQRSSAKDMIVEWHIKHGGQMFAQRLLPGMVVEILTASGLLIEKVDSEGMGK